MAHPETVPRPRALLAGVLAGGWRRVFLRWLALPAAGDRILVMYEGRIAGEADPRTATREEIGLLMAGTVPAG